MRVYEYAKKCGITSSKLLKILNDNGIYNKTAQSTITEEEIEKTLLEEQQKENPIPIKPVEINSKDFYDVKSELIDVYPEANYYVSVSPRGVGKSTNGILLALRTFIDEKCPSVLIRRHTEELNTGKLQEMFGEIISLGYVRYWTNDKYDSIMTIGMRSYLCKRDENGKLIDREADPFLYAIPLSVSSNYKGIQLNKAEEGKYVKFIIYDELIPVDGWYIPNECSLFFNCISSIVRRFKVAKIILFGNTIVGAANPILSEMGIDFLTFKVGEKRLYKYENDVEEETNWVACHLVNKENYGGVSNQNNMYFNFGNQKLSAITGKNDDETYGIWEISRDFSSKPRDYKKKDIIFKFYWIYADEIYCGEVVELKDCVFIYNRKTGHKIGDDWLDGQNELIFSEIYDPRPNWINRLNCNITIVKKLAGIIKSGKVYYQNGWVSSYFKSLFENL